MTPQQHGDRLSAMDVSFLSQEGATNHMHIGGLVLLEGPAPAYTDFLAHIRGRLHLVPRYRQKLAFPPLETGRPVWIDDPSFNLEYHVRHTALPEPGDEDSLHRLVGRVFSQRLDRAKPLWELWLVEGLSDGSCALISKIHHSLVDGISGVDLTTVLFDVEPREGPIPEPEPWIPEPAPSMAELAARGVQDALSQAAGGAVGAVGALSNPRELVRRAGEVIEGVGEVAMAAASPPPATPFNVLPGPHRRVAFVDADLDELKAIKNAFGGTVNDVVLSVVAGGIAHFMQTRGVMTTGLELRAAVPVSLRTEDQRGALGNELTQMIAPLPIDVGDPIDRLRRVSAAMSSLKESRQALGAKAIANLQDFAPPTILAQASRMNFSGRFYNLLVTNVPGPQFPLFVLGRRMRRIYPIPFLAGDRSLAVAIMSYDGGMNFGLLGDWDSMSDLDVVAEGIEGALGELYLLAAPGGRRTSTART